LQPPLTTTTTTLSLVDRLSTALCSQPRSIRASPITHRQPQLTLATASRRAILLLGDCSIAQHRITVPPHRHYCTVSPSPAFRRQALYIDLFAAPHIRSLVTRISESI
jgi:hypothetical protein